VQCLWVAWLALPHGLLLPGFALLAVVEMLIPAWAERAGTRPLFHAGHIEERYGLFTIIVLGESILSASVGFQAAVDEGGLTAGLLAVGLGGLVVAFGAWWLYFDHPGHLRPTPRQAFRWGYAHAFVFAPLAALGAGLHVAAGAAGAGDHQVDQRVAALAVALPVSFYLLGLALVMIVTGTPFSERRVRPKFIGAAAAIVVGLFAPVAVAVVGCALILAALVVRMVLTEPPGHPQVATVTSV
jgi:low temperature requirement protein LtrA